MNRGRLQKGSALSVMLILAMGVGSVVTTFLGRTLVEQSRVSQRAAQARAYRQAAGQLELAKGIINTAAYGGGENLAITAALALDPPVIGGTGVYVEPVGPDHWYRLTSCGEFADATAAVTAFVRDGTPYTGYNYYVEEHNLGISGKPRGKLHTNRRLDFYFDGGFYDGFVSAGEGFDYVAGAAPENTTLAGGADPASEMKDLLDLVDYSSLELQAAVVTPPLQEAVVSLLDKNVKIDLYDKPSVIQVPVTAWNPVLTGWVMTWENVTIYRKEWQWVNVSVSSKVWVVVDPQNEGTDVGGGGGAGGYWKTVWTVEPQWKLVNVPNGTVTVPKWVPQYRWDPYVVMVNQTVPGALVSSNTYAVNGQIFFISDTVKAISGKLDGRCTVVTDHDVTISNSIRYVDAEGDYAYLNGLDSTQPYDPNPAFKRNHAFGLIAKGDIRYARSTPANLEINGSLISTHGMVGMEGIVLDGSGNPSLSGGGSIKNSLRRFGTIMAAKRPVSTLLDGANQVIHGFTFGSSKYDEGLVMLMPPGYPSEEIAMWEPVAKVEGAAWTEPGDGTYDPDLVTPITDLLNAVQIRALVAALNFNWGC